MKNKILKYLYNKFPPKINLEDVYEKNKSFFERKFVEEFTGYIPKELKEPTLKIFSDQAETFQKWILWQSYYINRKSLHDIKNLVKYDGMMIYLKVLYLMAEVNKKPYMAQTDNVENKKVEVPWVDKALTGVEEFSNEFNKNNKKNGSESN